MDQARAGRRGKADEVDVRFVRRIEASDDPREHARIWRRKIGRDEREPNSRLSRMANDVSTCTCAWPPPIRTISVRTGPFMVLSKARSRASTGTGPWRKRVGVEPTKDRLTAPPGFEVRTPHRGRFSSMVMHINHLAAISQGTKRHQ